MKVTFFYLLLIILSILQLLFNAVTLQCEKSILYSRVSNIILIYSSILVFTSLYIFLNSAVIIQLIAFCLFIFLIYNKANFVYQSVMLRSILVFWHLILILRLKAYLY